MKDVIVHISEPSVIPSDTNFISLENIKHCENNSIDNILIQDLLDYCIQSNISDVIELVAQKLKSGGRLSIQGLDIKLLCVAVVFDEIDLLSICSTLYPNKKSIHTIHQIIGYINAAGGFNILIKKYINSVEYFILLEKL